MNSVGSEWGRRGTENPARSRTSKSGDEFTLTAEDPEWAETSLARVKVEAKGVVVVLPPEVDELGSDESWSVYVQCGIFGQGSPITDRAKRIVIPETGPDRATTRSFAAVE